MIIIADLQHQVIFKSFCKLFYRNNLNWETYFVPKHMIESTFQNWQANNPNHFTLQLASKYPSLSTKNDVAIQQKCNADTFCRKYS